MASFQILYKAPTFLGLRFPPFCFLFAYFIYAHDTTTAYSRLASVAKLVFHSEMTAIIFAARIGSHGKNSELMGQIKLSKVGIA
jgi:hypothetical protein